MLKFYEIPLPIFIFNSHRKNKLRENGNWASEQWIARGCPQFSNANNSK